MSDIKIVSLQVNLDYSPEVIAKSILLLYSKRFFKKMSLIGKEDFKKLLKVALQNGYIRLPLSNGSLDDLRSNNFKLLNKGKPVVLSIQDTDKLIAFDDDSSLRVAVYSQDILDFFLVYKSGSHYIGLQGSGLTVESTLDDVVSNINFVEKILYHEILRRILATHGGDISLKSLGVDGVGSSHIISPNSREIEHHHAVDDEDDERCDDCDFDCDCEC